MNSALNPKSVRKPGGAYSHTVRVPSDAEWLVISGQVGVAPNGKLAEGPRKQSVQVFKNLLACLRENGMRKQDIVKFTVYLTDSRYIADYRAARKQVIGDAVLPTSTLVIVDGLAAPEMLVEIEAWAAKSPRGGR